MKRMLIAGVGVFVTIVLAAAITFSMIKREIVEPPVGMLSVGPISVISFRVCPQVWPPMGWSRPCGDHQPWTLLGVFRWPRGEVWQHELVTIRIRD